MNGYFTCVCVFLPISICVHKFVCTYEKDNFKKIRNFAVVPPVLFPLCLSQGRTKIFSHECVRVVSNAPNLCHKEELTLVTYRRKVDGFSHLSPELTRCHQLYLSRRFVFAGILKLFFYVSLQTCLFFYLAL